MEENFTPIDDFFNDLLDETARRQVLERTRTDPDFAREFNLRQKMEDWLRSEPARQALKGQLAALGDEFFKTDAAAGQRPPVKVVPMRTAWFRALAAAAALLVLAVAVWFLVKPKASLYRQFAQHAPLQITVRGTDAAQLAADAEAAFDAGDYARALKNLEALAAEQPADLTFSLYRAICLLELERPADARALLQPIADGNSALRTEARWYLALTYLKENDLARCREILGGFAPGDPHSEAAKALLDKISAKPG